MDHPNWEQEEWLLIHERRHCAFSSSTPDTAGKQRPDNLVGLALSGGGIRSAIYNDGFVQGLSHRGLLRYVDYLSSVSGGGYIAGHLVAQARDLPDHADSNSQLKASSGSGGGKATPLPSAGPSFHDDKKRWELGRDPESGQVDPHRLAGVGGYLSRPLELLPAYLWSAFFSAAFYFGTVGICATLAALAWRSLDDPTFRVLYMDVWGIRMGNELLIAFIPFFGILAIYLLAECLLTAIRYPVGLDRPLFRRWHGLLRTFAIVALLLALLTSVAVFLGNGTTNIHANASGSMLLNKYAQWLAVIAGTLQLLVFLGSDRLFRSERQEAKSWQKHLQHFISVAVMLMLVFAMVHWMARDNISGYTQNRGPQLVRGDVRNWNVLSEVFDAYHQQWFGTGPLQITDQLPSELKPADVWQESLAARRLSFIEFFESSPATIPPSGWHLEYRLWGAIEAYRLAVLGIGEPELTSELERRIKQDPLGYLSMDSRGSPSIPVRLYLMTRTFENAQNDRVDEFNRALESPQFTRFLLARLGAQNDTFELSAALLQLVNSETIRLNENTKKLLLSTARKIDQTVILELSITPIRKLVNMMTGRSPGQLLSQRRDIATVNRVLLEGLFPSAISQMDIPSTLVVVPHDQDARRSWLGFWLMLTTLGALGGRWRNQFATVFRFYRRQLGANFLIRSDDSRLTHAERELNSLNPTSDGLPYPLLLASTLEPVKVNGGYRVECKPFLFSKLRSGNFSDPLNRIESKQISLYQGNESSAVTLQDAVTLSAAAVSPLMTNNRLLSILVDFFNTGIGKQVYRTSHGTNMRGDYAMRNRKRVLTVLSAVAAAAAILWITANVLFTVVAAILVLIVGWCLDQEAGSPHFIKMLMFPREVCPQSVTKSNARSARSFYVADGGFFDYLGITTLLHRRCELIVVSDAGANIGLDHLGTLANMCEKATSELGIKFLDLDHEAPIDFGRLKLDSEKRLVHQPYLCVRIRYPQTEEQTESSRVHEGLLIYCQMAITDQDPIEIQQIRNKFPSFPDEPTVNQFYTEEQVTAYRSLGYHIANRLCRELERWSFLRVQPTPSSSEAVVETPAVPFPAQPESAAAEYVRALRVGSPGLCDIGKPRCAPPYFDVVRERLLTAYRLACYEEVSFSKEDIFSEAIWPISRVAFPNFSSRVKEALLNFQAQSEFVSTWLRMFERSADVRSAYRKAVLEDINAMGLGTDSLTAWLWFEIDHLAGNVVTKDTRPILFAAHLATMAVACQEVHRGRPHATFQIGGRNKLMELCVSIADKICEALTYSTASGHADCNLRTNLDKIVAEVNELQRSIFQGGEYVTTISFTQCLVIMWGRLARQTTGPVDPSHLESIANRARKVYYSKKDRGQAESQLVETRKELALGFRAIDMDKVLKTLARLWYLGFFHTDAAKTFSEYPVGSFEFPGFEQLVYGLQELNDSQLTYHWMTQFDNHRFLRRAVVAAVRRDSQGVEAGCKANVVMLWEALLSMSDLVGLKQNPRQLLTCHLATVAMACQLISNAEAESRLSIHGRKRLKTICENIANEMPVWGEDRQLVAEDVRTTCAAPLLQEIEELDAFLGSGWSTQAKANFAHCVSAVYGCLARQHAMPPVGMEIDAQVRTHLQQSQNQPIGAEQILQCFEERKTDEAIGLMLRVWYYSYFTLEELEKILSNLTEPNLAAQATPDP